MDAIFSLRGLQSRTSPFTKRRRVSAFTARIDELFATLKPGEDDLAAIMRHAREIGQAIEGQLGPGVPAKQRR
jgi:hypothetical protein